MLVTNKIIEFNEKNFHVKMYGDPHNYRPFLKDPQILFFFDSATVNLFFNLSFMLSIVKKLLFL